MKLQSIIHHYSRAGTMLVMRESFWVNGYIFINIISGSETESVALWFLPNELQVTPLLKCPFA